ncbi:hypothetical protein [Nostoc sp. PCC 7524]|nr:hypothetical protein [Nostoc sp. PCC 7524]
MKFDIVGWAIAAHPTMLKMLAIETLNGKPNQELEVNSLVS